MNNHRKSVHMLSLLNMYSLYFTYRIRSLLFTDKPTYDEFAPPSFTILRFSFRKVNKLYWHGSETTCYISQRRVEKQAAFYCPGEKTTALQATKQTTSEE